MLNLKKVIASICVLAMVLSTVAFGATFADVAEDSVYYEAVETLNKLNIVEGKGEGNFAPEDGVTRAEMAALIARIQGYGETAKGAANTAFTDVPSSHWASGYIANAAGMGIINGYGDGTFGPEDPVLYEQAVKMIMATLGYTPFAEKNGGYPTGYLAAAGRYDVSLAVSNAAVGTEANRGTIAQLLVNAIDTPLMIQARWSNNGEVDYVIADGNTTGYPYQTLMSANLGYVKVRGVVEANSVTVIDGTKTIDTTKDATVTIDIVDDFSSTNSAWVRDGGASSISTFLVNGTDAEDYLGQSVIAYVEKIDNEWAIVSIAVDTARNDELVINLDQFSTGGTAGTDLKYYKDGANKTTDAKIDARSFDVVVNGEGGKTNVATEVAGLLNYGGQIRLIDNNDVRGYDIAIIDIAYTAVVDEVTKNKIVTKSTALPGGDIKFDLEDESKVLKVMKDGAEIDVAELVEYDVLSIYANSKNSDYILVEVLGSNVIGTVTSSKTSTTSQGGVAYKVNDTWYDVAAGAYKASDLDVGEGGTIYVDKFGKIAAFVEDAALAGGAAANYAYVIAVNGEESGFGGVEVSLQMLTADGVAVMKLANNAALELFANISVGNDETAITATKDLKLDLDKWDAGSDDKMGTTLDDGEKGRTIYAVIKAMAGDVIQYTANSNGYITRITEAGYDSDFEAAGTWVANQEFDSARNKFGSQKVEADTIVFVKGASATDIDKFSVTTLDSFVNEELYTISAGYQDKKSDAPNVIVVGVGQLTTSASASLAVVVEAGSATDKNNNEVWAITYLMDGELVKDALTSEDVATGTIPTAGDMIKINYTGDVITTLETVFNLSARLINSKKVDAATKGAYVATGLETIYGGLVTGCDEDYKISIADDIYTAGVGTSDIAGKYIDEAKNVYLVEKGRNAVTVDTGSYRDYGYFEELYTGNNVKLYFTDDSATTVPVSSKAAYGDYVYVREYDGDIIDVVIVKGMLDDVESTGSGNISVTFNGNGNDGGTTANMAAVPAGVATALTANGFTKTGHTFAGWNTAADGSGDAYTDAEVITSINNLDLYAQWTADAPAGGGAGA